MTDKKLDLILERVRPGKTLDCFRLWVCRGANKGCTANQFKSKRGQGKRCPDCVPCDDMQETLGELVDRINMGDA